MSTSLAAARYLFSYGSLITGALDPAVDQAMARWATRIGAASVAGQLFDLGEYPGAIPGKGRIKGVIWRLEQPARLIPVLDRYEDYMPGDESRSLYLRRLTAARLDDGQARRGWIYWLQTVPDTATPISDGDYMRWRTAGKSP